MNRSSKTIKLIGTALVLLFLIQIPVYSFGGHRSHGSNYTIPEGINLEAQEYIDGVYQGTATGFKPGVIVEVEVSNGALTSVEVIDHNEVGRQYYQRPIDFIPGAIIEEQSTDVDAVSGATATSKAIMSAVEDALKNAVK